MADKKTTKADVKTLEALNTELSERQKELMEARTGLAAGELANPRVVRTLKRDVARIKTEIRARELEPKEEEK